MSHLWKKKGVVANPDVHRYIISKELVHDKMLLPYDIQASIAHATMLGKVGLLTAKESMEIVSALKDIGHRYEKGTFNLGPDDEDCHSAIENELVKMLGDTGKKVHMGRSRNDQVLVAQRLFMKHALGRIQKETVDLASAILAFAKKYEFVPMPGYTHTQQAMPSSVGQWAGSFVESLLDDVAALAAARALVDQNPLGSAAGFGTGLPIDRELTTKLLGFSRSQINPIYCQNSRGKIESFTVAALLQLMMTLGKMANDVIWFTSHEFSFFEIDPSLTTGSSIMPQKRNLDIMEVLRANVSIMQGHQLQIQNAGHNLLSGYHKDLKITKSAVMDACNMASASLAISMTLFDGMKPNEARLRTALTPEIFATDEVNRLAASGMPFRDAYRKVGESLKKLSGEDPVKNIKSKKHLGATGNLGLKHYAKRIENLA